MIAKVLPLIPPGSEPTDVQLVSACASKDMSALSKLFCRHREGVHRFLARLVGPRSSDLEDLVQSTFLTAYSAAASYRSQATVRTWLFGIAANQARHHFRSKARRDAALKLLVAERPPSSPRPDDSLARRQLVGRLMSALEQLPHDLRVAYIMCEIEEVPGPEAAVVLGCRPGTLWRRLFDARKQLREALEKEARR